jgi:hypothetical protein|tara:strand:- start:12 stop:920 length:909 start_codon:yes stop_codon:yes gene_type:complete
MTFFVLFIKQYFRLIQWFLFLSFLIGQPKSKVVHTNIISESEKMEATFIFDEVIDRDDVSGWIDRNNYFTLSMFNVSFDSKQTLNKELKYPLVSIETADTDESVQIIFHTAREIESYQLIRHSKGKNVLIVLNYLDKEKKLKKEDGELVQSFIVEELPDTFDVMKDRWRHPKTWKDARERSSIRILCDTEGLPIYVDNQLVGKSPLDYAVDVLPGWHQVGYFPTDPALLPSPRSPKEKMMDNILRMGILDVYVEEGKEQEIVLNYQNLDQDVLAFQRSISAGSWIGFSLFFFLIMLISWGIA